MGININKKTMAWIVFVAIIAFLIWALSQPNLIIKALALAAGVFGFLYLFKGHKKPPTNPPTKPTIYTTVK